VSSIIGEGCRIENNAKLKNLVAGDKSRIKKGLKLSDEKIISDEET